jgi:alanyl-tRNA synthetase
MVMLNDMRADQIRQSFVDFFVAKGHKHVPSASLVPADDPTLLFTNAGMVQFKRVFQGVEDRGYRRAVTVQKCVRAGGKHNDLEQVGHTARHHTFFEMLGNFSFGDYFKRGAIEYAWEWVTSEAHLGIHPDRLYVTVHHSDDEAATLWHDVTGLRQDRIYRLGDADNFWQMGDTGPCGPCSEIYVDLRPTWKDGGSGRLPQSDFERLAEEGSLLEIWNLVFMQFDQAKDGSRSALPAPSVDTGAGLERIASVLQGVPSNFDTDLFRGLIDRAAEVLGLAYDPGPSGASFRVLADHARAVAFLLADGVYPSNEGRGYVLRRILRRAVRHAYLLGRKEPTLVHLVATVVDEMSPVYPELGRRRTHVQDVTRAEEERFLDTIEGGLKRLDELTAHGPGVIGGEDAFKLFDTYGFPIDLTAIIAQERGWRVDLPGFEQALERQRERSRAVADGAGAQSFSVLVKKPAEAWTTVTPRKRQRFVGYDTTDAETDILKFRQHGDHLDIMLHETPFYLESGGQVSDTGALRGDGWELPVDDVIKVDGRQAVTGPWEGPFEATAVHAAVDEPRRRDIERNHTATHLVHAALRRMLGTHVRQRGSVVDPDRLRFDFSHHNPVSPDELRAIEEAVNRDVWTNADITTNEMPYKEAVAKGAMALFGEKYGDVVRVVEVPDVSLELCGGTHVRSTGQIGLFRFVSESGVAANVRRIEAVTGRAAYHLLTQLEDRVSAATEILRTTPEHLARKVESLVQDNKRLEKQVGDLLRSGGGADQGFEEHHVGNVAVYIGESSLSDRNQIGALMDAFRERRQNAIATLFVTGERPGMHVSVTDDLVARGVRAGELVNQIAAVWGGRGGGRPHFASAGVGDVTRLDEAKRRTLEIIETVVSGG